MKLRSLILVGSLVWMVGCDLGITVGDPIDGRVDTEGTGGPEAGTTAQFETFTIATRGLTTEQASYSMVVGATAATNPAGCALFTNEHANPGQATSLVFAKFDTGTYAYCPVGSYAVNGDQARCSTLVSGELREDCAVYKRWDASGELVATIFAVGGAVTVTRKQVVDNDYTCFVELQLLFPGGVSWSDSYAVDYNESRKYPTCAEVTPNP
ncbi:MAG: hypothetical protein WBV82_22610 [Myxococcaceae bacterium]